MTISLSYDPLLSRVRIDATALDTAATAADVERSTDQITWSTVRGGLAVPVTAGVMQGTIDDYEFAADAECFYRVRAYDSAAIMFVAAGVAASAGSGSSLNPGLPAGLATNDLLLILASIRNGSPAGTVSTPAGYTALVSPTENVALFGKIAGASESAPTVNFVGAVGSADVIARTAAFRHAGLTVLAKNDQLNASAQNIARPALRAPELTRLIVRFAWKQDDLTTISLPSGYLSAGSDISTAGNDAAQSWQYLITTEAQDQPSGSYNVTGGAAAISRAGIAAFGQRVTNLDTDSITPTLDTVWIKVVARPYLNRPVDVVDFSEVTRPARAGVFDVVGRSFPVVVSDVRGSRRWALGVKVDTADAARDFDLLLASGEPVFVHVPADCRVPGGYAHVEATAEARPSGGRRSVRRVFTLPLIEVAAPGPDVIGAAGTCQTVLDTYATCQDVLTNVATCADLLELIGDSTEVIVS